jgi:acetolactate synthase small subunit
VTNEEIQRTINELIDKYRVVRYTTEDDILRRIENDPVYRDNPEIAEYCRHRELGRLIEVHLLEGLL